MRRSGSIAQVSGGCCKYAEAYRDHLEDNPHVRFVGERNSGFVSCVLTPEEWRVEIKVADSIAGPTSPVRTFASFAVEDGKPSVESA